MKLPEGWSLSGARYTGVGLLLELKLTDAARRVVQNQGYQQIEISLAEGSSPEELGLFDAINKMIGFDMDPLGTVQWWGTPNKFVGDAADNTPMEALKAGTLRVDQVLHEIEYSKFDDNPPKGSGL